MFGHQLALSLQFQLLLHIPQKVVHPGRCLEPLVDRVHAQGRVSDRTEGTAPHKRPIAVGGIEAGHVARCFFRLHFG